MASAHVAETGRAEGFHEARVRRRPDRTEGPLRTKLTAESPRASIKGKEVIDKAMALATSQILNAGTYFVCLLVAYKIPFLHHYALKFIDVQDAAAGSRTADDISFVVSTVYGVLLARGLVLAISMKWITPALGIRGRGKAIVRFAEQAWDFSYYLTFWLIGMNLLSSSGYTWYNPHQMWEGFPHVNVSKEMKRYYLIQLGHWLSQLYTLNVEERRKDHYQMFTHHVVTCFLIIGSYLNHYTRIGHIILVLMDLVDAQLCAAKLLKYMGWHRICDVAFLVFLVGWVCGRHGLFVYQLWYAYFEAPKFMANNCVESLEGTVRACYSQKAHNIFGSLLVVLQLITVVWLIMILKVVARVIRGQSAEDTRSDSEQ